MSKKNSCITTSLFIAAFLLFFPLFVFATETYKVDPVHSSILFRVKHLGISYVYGRFHNPSGTVKFDERAPENGLVTISAKVQDIDTGNTQRDDHLKSPDFFDAEKFPLISFKSRGTEQRDDDLYDVAGDMTVHGVTRPIIIVVEFTGSGKDPRGGFRVGAESTFNIKRSDYGMTTMLGPVGDDVRITVSIEAVRE